MKTAGSILLKEQFICFLAEQLDEKIDTTLVSVG